MKKSDMTKQRILQAAEQEFAAKGLYGARIDEIAMQAKANKRMIYSYFGNKEELYQRVLAEVYMRLARREEELQLEKDNPVKAIEQIVAMYFDFLKQDMNFVKLVMWENLNEARYLQQSQAPLIKDTALQRAREVLRQGKEMGIFRQDAEEEEFVFSLNMFCFSYFSNIYTMKHVMHIDFEKEEQIKRRTEHVTQVLLRYLSVDEADT